MQQSLVHPKIIFNRFSVKIMFIKMTWKLCEENLNTKAFNSTQSFIKDYWLLLDLKTDQIQS